MPARIVLLGASSPVVAALAGAVLDAGGDPLWAAVGTGVDPAAAAGLRRLTTVLAGIAAPTAGGGGLRGGGTVADPAAVRRLLDPGDVLIVATVDGSGGRPDGRLRLAVMQAAVDAGAHVLDVSAEPGLARASFEDLGPRAARRGSAVLPSCRAATIAGTLAGSAALTDAGDAAAALEIVQLRSAPPRRRRLLLAPAYHCRSGRVVAMSAAHRRRSVEFDGEVVPAVAVGGAEHFVFAEQRRLRAVDLLIGWPAAQSPAVAALAWAGALSARTGVLATAGGAVPDAAGGTILARVRDAAGRPIVEARLTSPPSGPDTAALVAWAASAAAAGDLRNVGALGVVQAFGVEAVTAALSKAGTGRV